MLLCAGTTSCPLVPLLTTWLLYPIRAYANLRPRTSFMPQSLELSLNHSFSFHINPSQMWWEQCLGHRNGLLSAKPFLMLLAKTSRSFRYGENTIISPCFHIYFVLTVIAVISILFSPTLLESARGQRQCLIVHHCLAWWSVQKTPTDGGWTECLLSPLFCHFHSLLFSDGPGLISVWHFRDNLAWFLFLNVNLPFTHSLFIQTLKTVSLISHFPVSCFLPN